MKNEEKQSQVNEAVAGVNEEQKAPDKKYRYFTYVFCAIAAILALFQLYTAQFGILTGIRQRAVHITLVLALTFLIKPFNRKEKLRSTLPPWYDLICVALALACGSYIVYMDQQLSLRQGLVTTEDIVFGSIMTVLIIEATRRMMGWALPGLALIMIFYAFFGDYFPSIIAHRGYGLRRIVSYLFLGTEGIFGTALNMSSTVIGIFIVFGAFLQHTGTGDFINKIAISVFGRVRGGPAKVAVIASTLFGSISGSAVANVVSTGAFTIPLMKRVGYQPAFAGAVEAVASTGGQIMPPVMGAAAFVISDVLGIPYIQLCLIGLIPALLYYLAVFVQVDMRAVKLGLKRLPEEKLGNPREIMKEGWYLFLPMVLLVVLLSYWSPTKVGFWVIVCSVVLSFMRKETRMTPSKIYEALVDAGKGMMEVGCACAISGILIGVFSLTGLGMKFSNILLQLANGNLLALLVLTMISCIVLGMGLSTLPVYLILSVLVAPALNKMGVWPLAAHLFIFYFGIAAAITPPVAIAAYAGASISGSDPIKVGFIAMRLGLAAFLLPYMFVFGPQLLLQGDTVSIARALSTAVIGILALSSACEGYIYGAGELNYLERALAFAAALLLIETSAITDIAGIAIMICIIVFHRVFAKRQMSE